MFRFTIRDLVLFTTIVAMGLGWWLHVRRLRGEATALERDLLMQSDFVHSFHYALTKLGCEIPPDSDPRCANGGPYTRIFVPPDVQRLTGCVSFTISGPREELQRTLDGEFGVRFRDRAP
jgi:hypothetical protein